MRTVARVGLTCIWPCGSEISVGRPSGSTIRGSCSTPLICVGALALYTVRRGRGQGDQLVVVNVEIPKALNTEQRQLIEQLGKTLGTETFPAEHGFIDWLKDALGG